MTRKLITLIIAVVLTLSMTVFSIDRTKADPPPLRILTLCDSITHDGIYQVELSRLLNVSGVAHVMLNGGVGGTGVDYWATNIVSVMNTHQPDMVLLNCGTNDSWLVGNNVALFEAKYRTIVESILNWRTPNRVKLGLSFIQYSTYPATQAMIDKQPATNDAIYRQLGYYTQWTTGLADFQKIPPNNLYLNSTGFHPTERGYKAMARIWYDAVRVNMGWSAPVDPPLCGMDGAPLLRGYARRTAIACQGQ